MVFFAVCSVHRWCLPSLRKTLLMQPGNYDGCLKGDFSKAAFYMVSDDENNKDWCNWKSLQGETIEQRGNTTKLQLLFLEEAALNDSYTLLITELLR